MVNLLVKMLINLLRRNLSPSEISLLSKGLKFVPTANKIDCEIENRIRRIWKEITATVALCKWWSFAADRFKPKSSFNPRYKDVVIETYIKGADKGSIVIFWDREAYLKETYRQLDDKEVYEQVPDDPSVLANTLIKALEKIRLQRDLPIPKFERFYLLPKIQKRLHDLPGSEFEFPLLYWKHILIFLLSLAITSLESQIVP